MAKDQDKGGAQAPQAVASAPAAARETISLPVADVELLQKAAAEVPVLLAAKEAAEAALAQAGRESAEYLRIAESNAAMHRSRATDLELQGEQDRKLFDRRMADLELQIGRERTRADGLAEQCQGLIGDLASIQQQLSAATTPSKEAAETEPLRAGHRRVITVQPYRFDTAQGPKSQPKGTVMQVPERDYKSDQLRRFPHLRDHGEYAAEVAQSAKRAAMPVDHASRNLESVQARVAEVMKIREMQREDLARRLTNPDYVAGQLPR